jgi:hypothetical protein
MATMGESEAREAIERARDVLRDIHRDMAREQLPYHKALLQARTDEDKEEAWQSMQAIARAYEPVLTMLRTAVAAVEAHLPPGSVVVTGSADIMRRLRL